MDNGAIQLEKQTNEPMEKGIVARLLSFFVLGSGSPSP